MLTLDQIKDYFPHPVARQNLRGILIEYLQYELLDSLFKLPGSEQLSFIGGTAIRIIYNSQRFSEDIDFDNFGLTFSQFKSLLLKACRELSIKGIEPEYRFLLKNKTAHCYIKFPSLLQRYGLTGHRDEKILVSVDAERKKRVVSPEIKTLNKFGIFRNLPVNSPSILLSQKLLAIIFRKREKGRDFYDASFLSGLTKPNYSYVERVSALSAEKFKEMLVRRCSRLNYKHLAQDVAPFLFDTNQKERVLHFRENLQNIL